MTERRWRWLGIAGALLACDSEEPVSPPGPGSAGAASGAFSVGGGGSPVAGSSGSSPGSGGQTVAGAGGGGSGGVANPGAGTSTGGAAGGGGGSGGTGGAAGVGGVGGATSSLPRRVLLYHFSTLAIESLAEQLQLLTERLQGWGYEVEESADPSDVSADNLARFAAVGMINTCFEPFGAGKMGTTEAAALAMFVAGGGGLFGTHCASVTFQSASPPHPYNEVIGGRGGDGYFDGTSSCRTLEQHATNAGLPATFSFFGNLDNADYLAPDAKVLVRCQWSAGAQKDVAVSWYRTPGKGRVFYSNFAKVAADLKDATLGEGHLLPGLGWVLGR